jgi:hypothetical protein
MSFLNFMFAGLTYITVLAYYYFSKKMQWKQLTNTKQVDAYWNAFQGVIWALAALAIRDGPQISVWTLIPILPTALIYGQISELPGMDFDLSSSFTPVQITALTFIGIAVVIYLGFIVYFLQSYSLFQIIKFLLPFLLFLTWMITWVNTRSETQDSQVIKYPYHLHHWMIALLGFFISRDCRIYSDIGSGIFWGIFCQELASYGIAMPVDIRYVQ